MTTGTTTALANPADLTERDQWVLWLEENDTKVPHQTNGRRASSTDPRTAEPRRICTIMHPKIMREVHAWKRKFDGKVGDYRLEGTR